MAHSLVQMLKSSVTLELRSRRQWKLLTNSERRVSSSEAWRKATAPHSTQIIQDSCVTMQDCSRWLQVTKSLTACCSILNLKARNKFIDEACPNFKEHQASFSPKMSQIAVNGFIVGEKSSRVQSMFRLFKALRKTCYRFLTVGIATYRPLLCAALVIGRCTNV